MDLEKTIYISSLYNIYGELLTKKQQQIIENYFFDNLSLAEIAENFNISRQAVMDSVNKSCAMLTKYENTLKVYKNNTKIKDLLTDLQSNLTNDKINKQISEIIENL